MREPSVRGELDTGGHLERLMDGEWLREQTLALGVWGPLLIVGLMALAIVLNPIPGAPIALVSGAVFGLGQRRCEQVDAGGEVDLGGHGCFLFSGFDMAVESPAHGGQRPGRGAADAFVSY